MWKLRHGGHGILRQETRRDDGRDDETEHVAFKHSRSLVRLSVAFPTPVTLHSRPLIRFDDTYIAITVTISLQI